MMETYPEIKGGALTGERYRVLISTDIGGSDPDDFQSIITIMQNRQFLLGHPVPFALIFLLHS